MSAKVHPLKDNQALAVDPRDSVWLSASAGTGKTQVLSARVLRLLLRPNIRPDQLLCLTFTKAGAAEMANRVNDVLASWVRLDEPQLFGQLENIGAETDPETMARARSLFANVLDCPGGGLRIDTIHAFAQWLLATFPNEAGLTPGTQPMEDRDRALLAGRVLSDLLQEWEERGETATISALEALSLRMGPDKARDWLMRCAKTREMWFGPGAWTPPFRNRLEGVLGLPIDCQASDLAEFCGDDIFPTDALRRCAQTLAQWNSKTGREGAEAIATWLAFSPEKRLANLGLFSGTLFTKTGAPKQLANILKRDPDYESPIHDVQEAITQVAEQQTLIAMVEWITPALEVGRRFAIAWDEAKAREGLIDFDDLIRRAAALLATPDMGQWIRYKLDRQFDHILIDEAQDTNAAQWSIVKALTDDFFTGFGQQDNALRTIFVVGDYKQAIFGFQGTSPENFAVAKLGYAQEMAERAENAVQLREQIPARHLQDLSLGRSFRSNQPVLTFVDDAIDAIGAENIGLSEMPEPHVGKAGAGLVTLWGVVAAKAVDDGEGGGSDGGGDSGDGQEAEWLSEPERDMADKIAAQIGDWLKQGFPLEREGRNAHAGDIMVLVRKRRALAGLIVARLHASGIGVTGVDRLRLGAPLAVKDLMAALRFAAQPYDNLSLANLLVSPLIGWSQQQLLDHAYRGQESGDDKKKLPPLWDHLRKSDHPDVAHALDLLRQLLRLADYEPPQSMLHWMLVGPWQGRRKLVERLGHEANDPIDELINAALAFSSSNTPSLQGFIRWFDSDESDLKRETGASQGKVRVMTVHGSKGLQSPIVILADACGNPDNAMQAEVNLFEDIAGGGGRTVPLPGLKGPETKVPAVAEPLEQSKRADLQEHWRLLYVAMTRAEEALFIGGALGKREKEPASDSWYARLAPLFAAQSNGVAISEDVEFSSIFEPDPTATGPLEDAIWGLRSERGEMAGAFSAKKNAAAAKAEAGSAPAEIPDWAKCPIGDEPRPPRPLAPSSAGEDQGADPPLPSDQLANAAKRGTLIHALLERLPDVAPENRQSAGERWLARNGADFDETARADMLGRALTVIAEPEWAELFSPAALAEVPLAARVGGQVISGTVDRLLIEENRVLVVDFKSARRPPSSLDTMPASTLKQMAAYVAALEKIYPGREIYAAVLYTQTPQLIAIPEAQLRAHKPSLSAMQ